MMAMETSSPLAAMQPPSLAQPWPQGRRDHPNFDSNFLRPPPYRPSRSFDFNRMSMQKPSSDYFAFKPVRGSSPTQSLAVDLSQNFHIDQSPQVPTPRRSLFTANLLGETRKHDVVTPPIPSSSPGPENDTMELSPLPHKQPQPLLPPLPLCSPTPEATPAAYQPTLRPDIVRSESQPIRPTALKLPDEGRKPMRPSMRKGYSHNGQTGPRPRTATVSQAPFWFGPGTSMLSKAPLETFMESPPSERKLPPSISNPSLLASPVPFNPVVQNGSPIPNTRRPPMARGRSGMARRTLSMQCNEPYKAMRAEKRCCTTGSIQTSLAGWEEPPKLKLPHFRPAADEPDALPRINMETLLDVMQGKYDSELGQSAIIDCRFEYEYDGGHIEGALNFNGKEEMAKELFEKGSHSGKALIFHCEYSAHRAPIMAKFIRQRDRAVNEDNYPQLTYPEIYILDGGYHNFFRHHPSRCFPQNYVEMDAKEHENACERGMAQVKRRAKLSRAQTYAFGQSSSTRPNDPVVPAVPASHPSLNASISAVDAMDVDFSSPIMMRLPAQVPPQNLSTCSISSQPSNSMRYPRRLDSY